jgi:hypothetical protein
MLETLREITVHAPEEFLEEYVMGRVQEPALSVLEEHLLTCAPCQTKLMELNEYTALMRGALKRLEQTCPAPSVSFAFSFPHIPGFGAVLAAAFVVMVVSASAVWHSQRNASSAAVTLTALRGGSADGLASAPAGRPLDLAVETANLEPAAAYRLELVDQNGIAKWSGQATITGTRLSAHVARGLRPGVYWVRLYAPGDELLREFGLRIQ